MTKQRDVTAVRVPTLERLVDSEQVWERVSKKYGVTNDTPPWKSSLDGMCDALDRNGEVLPLVARRSEEDLLGEKLYARLPYPERQLVALAHSLVARGVIDEAALNERMRQVRARLQA